MPTYHYACTACDERLEAVQSFSDAPLSECPVCGGSLRKVFSAVGVVFKGSGFYKNDSRDSARKGSSTVSEPAAASASTGEGSGSKSGSGETPKGAGTNGSGTNGSGTNGSGTKRSSSGGSGSGGGSPAPSAPSATPASSGSKSS